MSLITMTEWEAIQKRFSCRAYQDTVLSNERRQALAAFIQALNEESGLHFQLITTETPTLRLAGTMFEGAVTTYAALIGGRDDRSAEMVGYYGEKLVLYATQLGVASCWVAGTYDSKSVDAEIPEGEKLWDVVPFGYAVEKMPMKQKVIRASLRARDRKLEQFVESNVPFDQLPVWVQRGAEAVRLGPSAVNQQPVNLVYDAGKVSAKLWKNGRGLSFNDLGIAKYQFEAAAAECGVHGKWIFGDPGVFQVNE